MEADFPKKDIRDFRTAYPVVSIDNVQHNPHLDRWEMLICWAGFEQSESSREPAQSLVEVFQKFLQASRCVHSGFGMGVKMVSHYGNAVCHSGA
jgi:hypothetical protein